ncbi:MAG: hypothetical protein EPO11_03730 [Gammaproteobacteria bacterium]|nr:MAG: hypothetical protein EPO11_03730 [Gammaproteobacteria bacterium]
MFPRIDATYKKMKEESQALEIERNKLFNQQQEKNKNSLLNPTTFDHILPILLNQKELEFNNVMALAQTSSIMKKRVKENNNVNGVVKKGFMDKRAKRRNQPRVDVPVNISNVESNLTNALRNITSSYKILVSRCFLFGAIIGTMGGGTVGGILGFGMGGPIGAAVGGAVGAGLGVVGGAIVAPVVTTIGITIMAVPYLVGAAFFDGIDWLGSKLIAGYHKLRQKPLKKEINEMKALSNQPSLASTPALASNPTCVPTLEPTQASDLASASTVVSVSPSDQLVEIRARHALLFKQQKEKEVQAKKVELAQALSGLSNHLQEWKKTHYDTFNNPEKTNQNNQELSTYLEKIKKLLEEVNATDYVKSYYNNCIDHVKNFSVPDNVVSESTYFDKQFITPLISKVESLEKVVQREICTTNNTDELVTNYSPRC